MPHVVWIMCDQLRADALGFAHNNIVRTPNLDRLADRGVVFDQLYCQSSVCVPSRACMITGRYLRNLQMDNASSLLPPTYTTVPELFQRAGYRTGLFGKLHLTPQEYTRDELHTTHAIPDAQRFLGPAGLGPMPDDPVKRNYGFQHVQNHEDALWGAYADWLASRDAQLATRIEGNHFAIGEVWEKSGHPALPDVGPVNVDPKLHPSWFIADQAGEYFAKHSADGPCFMQVSFVDPHHPFDPPAEILRDYPADQMPLPKCRDAGNVVWPDSLAERIKGPHRPVDDDHTRLTIACYYAMIDQIDRSVGHLLDTIERAGQMDNTIFVFVADHGELLGDYGMWRKGSFHYDCLIRVPGFISYPSTFEARRVGELVQTIDLAPTVLGLAGLDVPDAMQGRNLVEPLRQGAGVGLDQIWCELFHTWWGPFVDCWTVRTPNAKLNWYPRDRVGHLFDLSADPLEQRDVFADPSHRDLRDQMTARLLQSICEQKDPLPRVLSQY